jgi:hypothetical protein
VVKLSFLFRGNKCSGRTIPSGPNQIDLTEGGQYTEYKKLKKQVIRVHDRCYLYSESESVVYFPHFVDSI